MRVLVLSVLTSLFLCLQPGCSVSPIGSVAANNGSLKEPSSVRLTCSNDKSYSTQEVRKSDRIRDILLEACGRIDQKQTHRIKYHKLHSTNRYVVVEGRIGIHGSRYPVVLDTGASQPIFLNVKHVLNNKLPIYSVKDSTLDLNGHNLGLCHLPELQIGDITLANWPCLYFEPRVTARLFGVPIASKASNDNTVIVGLPVLREFKYIMFDNVAKEVEFSRNESFEVGEADLWEKNPLSIEEDFHGNTFLFVLISIAGEQTELQLDTGSGRGLAIGEELWERVRAKIHVPNLRKGKDFYPYIGRLACRRGVVAKLEVGGRTVRNAEISIFPNDSPLLLECEGLVGMQYFQNTVAVLDFERNLMWVKNRRY